MTNQIWLIEPVSFICEKNAVYKISSATDYGMSLDASNSSGSLNNIILYTCHNGSNQKFSILVCKGKYLIINKKNKLSLQVEKESS